MVKTVGSYDIYRTIGVGSYGKVKFAVHRDTKEEVAIKVSWKIGASTVRAAPDPVFGYILCFINDKLTYSSTFVSMLHFR